jgi:hypothetical protein
MIKKYLRQNKLFSLKLLTRKYLLDHHFFNLTFETFLNEYNMDYFSHRLC